MKRNLPRFIFVFSLLASIFFTLPKITHAQTPPASDPCSAKNKSIPNSDGTSTYVSYTTSDFGCIPDDPIAFAEQYYGIGLSIIGGLALIFIIIGGFTFMTSQGNPATVNKAKSYIFYAIAGLLLAIFGYVFIQVVVIDILHLPGFN